MAYTAKDEAKFREAGIHLAEVHLASGHRPARPLPREMESLVDRFFVGAPPGPDPTATPLKGTDFDGILRDSVTLLKWLVLFSLVGACGIVLLVMVVGGSFWGSLATAAALAASVWLWRWTLARARLRDRRAREWNAWRANDTEARAQISRAIEAAYHARMRARGASNFRSEH